MQKYLAFRFPPRPILDQTPSARRVVCPAARQAPPPNCGPAASLELLGRNWFKVQTLSEHNKAKRTNQNNTKQGKQNKTKQSPNKPKTNKTKPTKATLHTNIRNETKQIQKQSNASTQTPANCGVEERPSRQPISKASNMGVCQADIIHSHCVALPCLLHECENIHASYITYVHMGVCVCAHDLHFPNDCHIPRCQ